MSDPFFKPANKHSISSVEPCDEPDDSQWRDELHLWYDTVFCRQGRTEQRQAEYGDD